jgi:hypothetical protein
LRREFDALLDNEYLERLEYSDGPIGSSLSLALLTPPIELWRLEEYPPVEMVVADNLLV